MICFICYLLVMASAYDGRSNAMQLLNPLLFRLLFRHQGQSISAAN